MQSLNNEYNSFNAILKQYPNIFPERFLSEKLFNICYSHVYSRCFDYGLDSPSLVPMADNHNHNCVDTTREFINLDIHQNGPDDELCYRKSKFLSDYTPIFEHRNKDQKSNTNIKGRCDFKTFNNI